MEIEDKNVKNQLNNIQNEILEKQGKIQKLKNELDKRMSSNTKYNEVLSQIDRYDEPIRESEYWGSEEFAINAKITSLEEQINKLKRDYWGVKFSYEFGLLEQEVDPIKALAKAANMSIQVRLEYLHKLKEELGNKTDLTEEFLVDLVRADGAAIFYIPEEFINQEIILEAIKKEPRALVMALNANNDFEDKSFIKKVIETNPDSLLILNTDIETKLRDMDLLDDFVTTKIENSTRVFVEDFMENNSLANMSPQFIPTILDALEAEGREQKLLAYSDTLKQLVHQGVTEKIVFYRENPEALNAEIKKIKEQKQAKSQQSSKNNSANFSLDAIAQIDEQITWDDRNDGTQKLTQALQEIRKPEKQKEGKEGEDI